MKKVVLGFFLFLGSLLYGVQDVYVVPVKPTPEASTIVTKIIFPRPYENKRKTPINVQLRIEGFPLGVITQNDRAKEIYNDPEGQAIHVIIDNHPYLIYNESFEDSFDENREYYDKILSFAIPFTLKPGQHVIRCFPARSYGESLKDKGPFSAEIFYFQDRKKSDTLNVDLQKPYLTYNEPQGKYPASKSNPILLDFLISNCELSPDGYKVALMIDGKNIQALTDYVPYYIYNLPPGKHTVKLQLLDNNNKTVPGFFNVTEREIEIDQYIDSDS
ncbi:MAG: hypothetical protein H7A41_04640 [Chlamydiales bacterium]|nr:hypothetical protein [Chlamydiia bacterium]MCP5504422.1 hypothetical protein [Chlamydiales bacterium]